ncbi:MAG: phosphotransferase [Corynebacterium sp.]|nr:phosphotransferase [Corynebacterium sp.]
MDQVDLGVDEGPGVIESTLGEDDIVSIAQDLLTLRYGGQQTLTQVEKLAGSGAGEVFRARVAPSPFLPQRSVVVKHNPATGLAIDDYALLCEIVAYQFTTSLPEDLRPGPVLLAYDVDKRIVVLTDLGDSETLSEALDHSDSESRRVLLRTLGCDLGRMHAGTAGREFEFDLLYNRLFRKNPTFATNQRQRTEALHQSIYVGLDILRREGFEVPDTFVEYAHCAAAALLSGSERAFTPLDLSPDNILVNKKMYFLDYEWAGFRNVVFDVACVVAGFPQFLFTSPISSEEADIFISAWAREVESTWPRFADREVRNNQIIASLIGWALSSVTTMFTGGLVGLSALAQGDISLDECVNKAVLRSGKMTPFSEEELLIRRDLFETFEALARFSQHADTSVEVPQHADISAFSSAAAKRLAWPPAF